MAVVKITLDNFQSEVSKSEKPVLIDFYADWCEPCKMFAPEIAAFAEETNKVKVCKINVDECADIAAMYGILSIPTIIVVKGGKEVSRRVGGGEKQDLEVFVDTSLV